MIRATKVFLDELEEDRPLLVGIFMVWILLEAALISKGVPAFSLGSYLGNFLVYAATTFFMILPLAARRLILDRPHHPIGHLLGWAREPAASGRIARGMPLFLALVFFLPAFSAIKSAIPLFHPYDWDQTWIDLDIAIHGTDPWRILQPVFGYPFVTFLLSLLYHVWILLIYAGGIYFVFFESDRRLRMRYFISFFGIWTIIGVVMATLLASVGPCFDGPILGIDHYAEQMAYLRHANEHFPVVVLDVQDALIRWYQTDNHGLGRGISAMPSMHIAMVYLFFLAMWNKSSRLGYVFGPCVVLIFIGSIVLGYHYAVDGYVSFLATTLIWLLAGKLASAMSIPEDGNYQAISRRERESS